MFQFVSDQWLPEIASVLGIFGITIVGSVLCAYGLFRWLGQKWLETKFQKDMENFKFEKNREIELLRIKYQSESDLFKSEASRLLDRATKLHGREYEILPNAWSLLSKAYGATGDLVSRLQSYPNFEVMSTAEIYEFFENSTYPESVKTKILNAKDKKEEFFRARTWRLLDIADKELVNFSNYIILNEVLIDREITEKFYSISENLKSAILYRRSIVEGYGSSSSWEEAVTQYQASEKIVNETKDLIRKRLFDIKPE